MTNPKSIQTHSTGGKKASKIEELGSYDPQALLELARVGGWGWRKHGERHNFAKGFPWSWSYEAMQRHILYWLAGEDRDPESGYHHLAHAAWHCLALMTFQMFNKGVDDRFPLRKGKANVSHR